MNFVFIKFDFTILFINNKGKMQFIIIIILNPNIQFPLKTIIFNLSKNTQIK